MRAFIYGRYSSDEQRTESITAQVRACEEYAAHHGYEIVKTYADEAVSGKGTATAKRTQYQKMMKDAEAGKCDAILIHKYDRIARNVKEHVSIASRLSACNVELIAVNQDFGTSKEAKVMKVLTWAMSELYIDNLSEETQKGHKETALQGLHNGGVPPFGYDVKEQRYQINDLEALYVRRMFSACVAGEPFGALLLEMNQAGIRGKRGRPLTYSAIYEILRNEKYTGVYLYTVNEETSRTDRRKKPHAIRIEDAFPAIVSREQWEGAQKIMDTRKNTGRKSKTFYTLSGIIYCGECGSPMHAHTSHRKKASGDYEYSYYRCPKKCGNSSVRADRADAFICEFIRSLLTPENRALLIDCLKKYETQIRAATATDTQHSKREISSRETQINTIVQNMSAGVLPAPILEKMSQQIMELQSQIDLLQAEIDKPFSFDVATVSQYFDAISDLESQPESVRRATVQKYVERVDVQKNAAKVSSTLATFLGKVGCGGQI